MYKMRYPKSDVDRLYLPRTEGGRGLIQPEPSYKSTTIGLDKYLQKTHDTLLHFVKDHDDRKSLYFISRQSMKFSRGLGLPAIPPAEYYTTYARITKAKAKHQGCQQLRSTWKSKAIHGKYPQRVKQADVDQDKTHRWLKAAGLKAETEGFIIAPKIKASQHAGTNTSSSRSLTWTQNVDCMPFRRDHWPPGLWLSWTSQNWIHPLLQQGSCTQALEDLQRVWHWQRHYSVGHAHPRWQDHSS